MLLLKIGHLLKFLNLFRLLTKFFLDFILALKHVIDAFEVVIGEDGEFLKLEAVLFAVVRDKVSDALFWLAYFSEGADKCINGDFKFCFCLE